MTLSISSNNNEDKGIWEFKLVGEVDVSNVQALKTQLETALDETRQSITIDLAELKYIDSTGLGVMMGVYGLIKKDGLTIKIINPRDNVKKLLNISGLDKILC